MRKPHPELQTEIQRVIDAGTDNFIELAKVLGKNPLEDFACANLSGINFHRANLKGADLHGANLSRTNLVLLT